MIAVDTNILVYAHRAEMPFHKIARGKLEALISETANWAIPWPCVHEFIAVVTNPRIFKTPTPIVVGFDTISSWQQGSNLCFLSEAAEYLTTLSDLAKAAHLQGAKIHDARVAALCLHHRVSELWSCDRDFSLFPRLKTRNPLV